MAQKDEAGAEATLEQLVAQFNDPEDWTQMIDVAISSKGIRDVEVVWLGRLIFLSGATPSQQDANLFGATASHLTFFGDAQVAQQHGGTGFPDPNARADADKKTIPAQIAAEHEAERQLQRQARRSPLQLWHVSGSGSRGQGGDDQGRRRLTPPKRRWCWARR